MNTTDYITPLSEHGDRIVLDDGTELTLSITTVARHEVWTLTHTRSASIEVPERLEGEARAVIVTVLADELQLA